MEEIRHAHELVESSRFARIFKKISILFFICIFFLFPRSYARTTLTDDEAQYIYDWLFGTEYFNEYTISFTGNSDSTNYNVWLKNELTNTVNATKIKNFFNSNNTLDFGDDPRNLVFFLRTYKPYNYMSLYYTTLALDYDAENFDGWLEIYAYPDNTNALRIVARDDGENIISTYPMKAINIYAGGGTWQYVSTTMGNIDTNNKTNVYWRQNTYDNSTNTGKTILEPIPGIVTFAKNFEVYTNWNGSSTGSFDWYELKTSYPYAIVPEPIYPTYSGENGTITNPSGETIGNVDLTGIQSGINDLNTNVNKVEDAIKSGDTALINNQNQNTEKIVDTISGETEKIIGEITSVPDLSGETITSGEIIEATGVTLATDPYANFWYAFTTGLGQALTETTKNSITINWMGKNETISLTDVHNPLPQALQTFLTLIMGSLLTYGMLVEIKGFINDIQKGGIITTTSRNRLDEDIYTVYF